MGEKGDTGPQSAPVRRAVFLDRDGTINEEVDFLGDPEKVVLIQGAAEGLALLREAGFELIVVSNQSGVARGFFIEEDVCAVNQRLVDMLKAVQFPDQ